MFTAKPSSGFDVDEWFVDNKRIQTGGKTFTLENIRENHSVRVMFAAVKKVELKPVTLTVGGTPISGLRGKVASYPRITEKMYRVPVYNMTLQGQNGEKKEYEVLRFGVRLDKSEPDSKDRMFGMTNQYEQLVLTEFDPKYLAGSWVIAHLSQGRTMIHDGNTLEAGVANLGCIAVMARSKKQNAFRNFLADLLKFTGARSQLEIADARVLRFNSESAETPDLIEW
jgi:hypothetical protein